MLYFQLIIIYIGLFLKYLHLELLTHKQQRLFHDLIHNIINLPKIGLLVHFLDPYLIVRPVR